MKPNFKLKNQSKESSLPEDWSVFKDMLLNLRLAVLSDNKPHKKIRVLALKWYSDGKYRNPVCDAVLTRLVADKRPKQTLDELISIYIDLEEGTEK